MNTTMTDADIHAFGRPTMPPAAPDTPRAPHRVWLWVLLALTALFVASVAAGVLVLGHALDQVLGGLDVRIDGEQVLSVPRGEAAWWAVGAAVLAAMVVLVVVPLVLLLALVIVALVLAGLVVLALVAGALVLSPLWVLALLLWLALRPPPAARGAAAAPAPVHGPTQASSGA